MPITLRQLQAFQSIADTGSFTLAAERLGLTQSAVSMQIRQLEVEIGMVLFERSGRATELTEFGRQIRNTVSRMLVDLQNLTDGAADLRALRRGHLRIAVPQILACSWLPGVLSRYRKAYPDVELSVMDTTGDRVVEAVAMNDAEIGLGPERILPSGVTGDYFWRSAMQVVLPLGQPPGPEEPLTWGRLGAERWIRYSDEFSLHLDRTVFRDPVRATAGAISVRGLTTALALVGAGQGLTIAPSYAAIFSDIFGVMFRDLPGPTEKRVYNIYARTGQDLSPAALAFRTMAMAARPTADQLLVRRSGA